MYDHFITTYLCLFLCLLPQRFQDIEENHLKQMKEFLSTYIELLQNNHDMVGQVHSEFKRQFLEMTVDKLLEQFVLSKYTGLEKPGEYMNIFMWICQWRRISLSLCECLFHVC